MIDLVSKEGISIPASKDAIRCSKTLCDMMDDVEAHSIPVPNVDSDTLHKIVEWSTYHAVNSHTAAFDDEFFKDIDRDSLIQLMLSSYYLDVETLVDLGIQKFADMLKDQSVEEVMQTLQIEKCGFKKRCSCCGCLQTDDDESACAVSEVTDGPSTVVTDGPLIEELEAPISLKNETLLA